MRIGFLLLRQTYLKTMGELINTSLKAGHEVVLFYQSSMGEGEKAYQNISLGSIPTFTDGKPQTVEIELKQLADYILPREIDALITHEGYHVGRNRGFLSELAQLRQHNVYVVSLSHFYEIVQQPIEALHHFDLTIYPSEFARELHFKLHSPPGQSSKLQSEYASRISVAGSPLFDLVQRANPADIFSRYNLPLEKPIVLLIAPLLSPVTPWRNIVWRHRSKLARTYLAIKEKRWHLLPEIWNGDTFYDAMVAIRAFCDDNNYSLVVKSREKQDDPGYVLDLADLYINGTKEDYYPTFTTHSLLAASDLCITAMSMTALEAATIEVPVVNIFLPPVDWEPPRTAIYNRYLEELLGNEQPGLMNYPGCVNTIGRNEIASWLADKNIQSIPRSTSAQKEYARKYLGMDRKSSSERILETLSTLLKKKTLQEMV